MEIKLIDWIKNDSIDEVKNCLESGADVHYDNEKALRLACSLGYTDTVKLLLSYGANLHHGEDYCLFEAVVRSHEDLTKFLIKAGADVQNLSQHSEHIVEVCKPEFIQYLIDSGLKVTESMLEYAAELDQLDTFKLIYRNLEPVNLSNVWRIAYGNQSFTIMKYLLDLDIELDLTNTDLIRCILTNAQIEIIKKILNRVSDYRSFLITGSLKCACLSRDYETIKLVLELIGNANDASDLVYGGPTPFESITIHKSLSGLESTPLEIATDANSYPIAKLLLEHGAIPTKKCIYHAVISDNYELYKLIFHSEKWDSKTLSEALYEAIDFGVQEEIWKHLQGEVGSDLNSESLGKIVRECIRNCEFKTLDYFIGFYGQNVIFDSVKKCKDLHLSDGMDKFLKERYDFQL